MITLYSTNCLKCMVLKEKLYAKHIEFTECNDTEIMKELGMTVVPVLKVNDEYLDFKAANTYINQQ